MSTAFTRCVRLPLVVAIAFSCAPASEMIGAEYLYWTSMDDYPSFSIRRSDLDGEGIETLVTGTRGDLAGLAVDARGGFLYWIENSGLTGRIVRADVEGSDPVTLLSVDGFLSQLALDEHDNALYFTVGGAVPEAGIRRLDLDSGDPETVIVAELTGLAVDGAGGHLFWVQEGTPGAEVWRARTDGSGAMRIAQHPFDHHTTGLAVDPSGGKLYWATVDYRETHAQVIYRANFDGSEVETVTTANPGLDDWPVYLALDIADRTLYWVNGEDGEFYRVAVDGGDAVRLHEDPGTAGPFGLVVVALEESPAAPEFRRGDADGDGALAVTDAVVTLRFLFLGAAALRCDDAADTDDDGVVAMTDALSSLGYQFHGAVVIPPPGALLCGADPTPDDGLGCAAYASCTP